MLVVLASTPVVFVQSNAVANSTPMAPRPSESVPFGGEARAGQSGLEAASLTPSRDFSVAALDQPRNAKRSLKARIALSPRRSLAAERAPTDPPTLAVADRPAAGPAEDTLPAEMCAALDSLLETVGKTASPASVELVMRAAQLAIESHQAETRQSGEPYAMHLIAVATILAHMQLDAETVAAALLHDVIEDTPISLERVESQFGGRVARLVDGVTKARSHPLDC